MRLGTGVVKPRIVIEFDPVKGGSVLKTYGNLTVPIVIDTLMAQQASLWRQWITQLQSPVTDANGQPIVKPANTAMPEGEAEPDEEPNSGGVIQ